MPRMARQKKEVAIYHVMARSISEVQLFKSNKDKQKYLSLIKEYQNVFNFKVYAYCLMNNHIHLILDSNGADISKIMHCINFKYARYFNSFHKRHGHLFQDRFKSKIVKDYKYLVVLSAYIHNNPLDVKGYEKNPENYYYSSLGIYLGIRQDENNLLDEGFILSLFAKDKNARIKGYIRVLTKSRGTDADNIANDETEFKVEKSEYRSERKVLVRDFKAENVIQFVVDKFQIEKSLLYLKYQRSVLPARGLLALLLRNLCNASCKDICNILGNITSSGVSKLSSIGVSLVCNDEKYKEILNDFIACNC